MLSYQTIISRNLDPQSAAVLSVGAIEAGRDNNVIPQTATLKLNLRWFDSAVRDMMIRRIDEIRSRCRHQCRRSRRAAPDRTNEGVGRAFGERCRAGLGWIDPALKQLLGETMVVNNFPAVTGSEDFQEVWIMVAADVPYGFPADGGRCGRWREFRGGGEGGAGWPPNSNHNPRISSSMLKAIALGTKGSTDGFGVVLLAM